MRRRELLAILASLGSGASAFLRPAPHPGPAALETRLAAARAQFDHCHYRAVGDQLPRLIEHATTAAERSTLARSILARSYCLAAFVASKLGDAALAWALSERARLHADLAGDPVAIAMAAREVAVSMRTAGYHSLAVRLLTSTADNLDPTHLHRLAATGALLLTAARAAAEGHDRDTAITLITESADLAPRLTPPLGPAGHSLFAPHQLPIYRAIVYNTLGDHPRALAAAHAAPTDTMPTTERKATLHLAQARAWLGNGNPARCALTLQALNRVAPEEARRPAVRTLITTLLDRNDTPPIAVELAHHIGVPT